MKRTLPLFVAAMLLQTACNRHDDASPVAPAASASTTFAENSTCPAMFDAFLSRFENEVAVQRTAMADPLQWEAVDTHADPEPKPITTMRSIANVTFPLMPDEATQLRTGLVATRNDIGAREVSIRLTRPDTDDQTTYFFRKRTCWQLYRIKDDSL